MFSILKSAYPLLFSVIIVIMFLTFYYFAFAEEKMAFKDYEEQLTKRLLVLAGIYTALLMAVQIPTILISVKFARLSTDLLFNGSLEGLKIAIMILSPLSNYIRCAFILWVTFYYGKKNSVTVLIITVGSLILSVGMEASPDRTSDVFFMYDWNTKLIEYAIRFVAALAVTFILWFTASSLGSSYRKQRRHNKKLPVMRTYLYASLAFLSVDLLFQFYFFLSSANMGPNAPTALDWIYPFVKAGCGFLVSCGIGLVLTSVRRKYRRKDKEEKERAKAEAASAPDPLA